MSLQRPSSQSTDDLTLRIPSRAEAAAPVQPADDLRVTVAGTSDVAVVTVAGELDLATSPRLRETLSGLVSTGRRRVVLDLDGVSFMDSTGLGVLVAAHRRMAAVAGSIAVVCHVPRCLRLMEITGMTRILAFHDSVALAVSHLTPSPTAPERA